jgi:hypothetical protein
MEKYNKGLAVGCSSLKLHVYWRAHAGQAGRREATAVRARAALKGEEVEGFSPEWLRRRSKDGGLSVERSWWIRWWLGEKMAALVEQPDGGDDIEAGTGGSEAWRVDGADTKLGGGSLEVAGAEWSVAALRVRSPGVRAPSTTRRDTTSSRSSRGARCSEELGSGGRRRSGVARRMRRRAAEIEGKAGSTLDNDGSVGWRVLTVLGGTAGRVTHEAWRQLGTRSGGIDRCVALCSAWRPRGRRSLARGAR